MPLTVLRRDGPGVVLILCGFVVYTSGRFMFSLALLFVLVFFFQSFQHVCSPRLGKRQLVYVRLVHFFLRTLIFVLSIFLLVSVLAATCDCGTPWTFPLTVSIHLPWASNTSGLLSQGEPLTKKLSWNAGGVHCFNEDEIDLSKTVGCVEA